VAGARQFDGETVIEHVLEHFRRHGFAGTSMPELAKATVVQRGSLYNAYGGKEELFLRAFDLYALRLLAAAREALDRRDPEKALLAFFDTIIADMTDGSPARGCLSTKTAAESGEAGPRIRERLRNLLDELTGIVRRASAKPKWAKRLTLEPSETAQVIVTFTRGLAVMERVYRDPKRLKKSAAALVRALVVPK
jgi:AcrR family transcriptional regulator